MKKLNNLYSVGIFCVLFLGLIGAHPAYGTTRYIAQTAGTFSGGTACNGQVTITPANWNGITNAPGDINYICGTITGAAGSTLLIAKGNGAAGNPVVLKFDTGAILQAPYFAPSTNGVGAGGAIAISGVNYWTLDGQNTGTIQNTANGTGMGNHSTEAVEAEGCNNCTIQNLTIANMYVISGSNDASVSYDTTRCLTVGGASNVLVQHNTMHDAGWCVIHYYQNGDSNVEFSNNTIYAVSHGITLESGTAGGNSGPFKIDGNNIYNLGKWATTSDAYHLAGIHCYTFGSGNAAHINSLQIYNNVFNGPLVNGNDVTAYIFLEGGSGSGATPCADSTSGIQVYNNVAIADQYIYNGLFGLFSGNYTSANGGGVYNNTLISTDASAGGACITMNSVVSGTTFQNNAMTGCDTLINIGDKIPFSPNFNQYANSASNAFNCNGTFFTSADFSSWQSCIKGDANSGYSTSLNLNGSGIPQTGSKLIGSGTNLSSLCNGTMTALCSDIAGNPRPSTGSWTVGAYISSGSAAARPAAAGGLTGTVTAK